MAHGNPNFGSIFGGVAEHEIQEKVETAIADTDVNKLKKMGGVIWWIAEAVIAMDPSIRSVGLTTIGETIKATPAIPGLIRVPLTGGIKAIAPGIERMLKRQDLTSKELKDKLFESVKDGSPVHQEITEPGKACTGDHEYDPIHKTDGCAGAKVHNAFTGSIYTMFKTYPHRPICPICFGPEFAAGIIKTEPEAHSSPTLIGVITPEQRKSLAVLEGIFDLRVRDIINEPTRANTLMDAHHAGLLAEPHVVEFLPELTPDEYNDALEAILQVAEADRKNLPLPVVELDLIHTTLQRYRPFLAVIRHVGRDDEALQDSAWFHIKGVLDTFDDKFTSVDRVEWKVYKADLLSKVKTMGPEFASSIWGWVKNIAKAVIISWVSIFVVSLVLAVGGYLVLTGTTLILLFVNYPVQQMFGITGQFWYVYNGQLYFSLWAALMLGVWIIHLAGLVATLISRFSIALLDMMHNTILGGLRFIASVLQMEKAKMVAELAIKVIKGMRELLPGTPEVATAPSSSSTTPAVTPKRVEGMAMLGTTWTIISFVVTILVTCVYYFNMGIAGSMAAVVIGGLVGLLAEMMRHWAWRISEEFKIKAILRTISWVTWATVALLFIFACAGGGYGTITSISAKYKVYSCLEQPADRQPEHCKSKQRSWRFGP
ncbi:MAG: hypothetical protein ABH846_01310 [Patescibacteria group bacterium]